MTNDELFNLGRDIHLAAMRARRMDKTIAFKDQITDQSYKATVRLGIKMDLVDEALLMYWRLNGQRAVAVRLKKKFDKKEGARQKRAAQRIQRAAQRAENTKPIQGELKDVVMMTGADILRQRYIAWIEKYDLIPGDVFFKHFIPDLTAGSFSLDLVALRAEFEKQGYSFVGAHWYGLDGFHVTIRPVTKEQLKKQLLDSIEAGNKKDATLLFMELIGVNEKGANNGK